MKPRRRDRPGRRTRQPLRGARPQARAGAGRQRRVLARTLRHAIASHLPVVVVTTERAGGAGAPACRRARRRHPARRRRRPRHWAWATRSPPASARGRTRQRLAGAAGRHAAGAAATMPRWRGRSTSIPSPMRSTAGRRGHPVGFAAELYSELVDAHRRRRRAPPGGALSGAGRRGRRSAACWSTSTPRQTSTRCARAGARARQRSGARADDGRALDRKLVVRAPSATRRSISRSRMPRSRRRARCRAGTRACVP